MGQSRERTLRQLVREMTRDEARRLLPEIFTGTTTRGPLLEILDSALMDSYLIDFALDIVPNLQELGDKVRGVVYGKVLDVELKGAYEVSREIEAIRIPKNQTEDRRRRADISFVSDATRVGDTLHWKLSGGERPKPQIAQTLDDLISDTFDELRVRIAITSRTDNPGYNPVVNERTISLDDSHRLRFADPLKVARAIAFNVKNIISNIYFDPGV